MNQSFNHSENCALSRSIKRARVDGPKLRIQWLASGADQSPPGTFYTADIAGTPARSFSVFMPAPVNNRASVKAALMNQLEGLTQSQAAITVQEITNPQPQ